jgi:hypothetical protein
MTAGPVRQPGIFPPALPPGDRAGLDGSYLIPLQQQ